ncbi:hypothetical protein HDU76_008382, partial [Blyttiomyces sp. JEL0837]
MQNWIIQYQLQQLQQQQQHQQYQNPKRKWDTLNSNNNNNIDSTSFAANYHHFEPSSELQIDWDIFNPPLSPNDYTTTTKTDIFKPSLENNNSTDYGIMTPALTARSFDSPLSNQQLQPSPLLSDHFAWEGSANGTGSTSNDNLAPFGELEDLMMHDCATTVSATSVANHMSLPTKSVDQVLGLGMGMVGGDTIESGNFWKVLGEDEFGVGGDQVDEGSLSHLMTKAQSQNLLGGAGGSGTLDNNNNRNNLTVPMGNIVSMPTTPEMTSTLVSSMGSTAIVSPRIIASNNNKLGPEFRSTRNGGDVALLTTNESPSIVAANGIHGGVHHGITKGVMMRNPDHVMQNFSAHQIPDHMLKAAGAPTNNLLSSDKFVLVDSSSSSVSSASPTRNIKTTIDTSTSAAVDTRPARNGSDGSEIASARADVNEVFAALFSEEEDNNNRNYSALQETMEQQQLRSKLNNNRFINNTVISQLPSSASIRAPSSAAMTIPADAVLRRVQPAAQKTFSSDQQPDTRSRLPRPPTPAITTSSSSTTSSNDTNTEVPQTISLKAVETSPLLEVPEQDLGRRWSVVSPPSPALADTDVPALEVYGDEEDDDMFSDDEGEGGVQAEGAEGGGEAVDEELGPYDGYDMDLLDEDEVESLKEEWRAQTHSGGIPHRLEGILEEDEDAEEESDDDGEHQSGPSKLPSINIPDGHISSPASPPKLTSSTRPRVTSPAQSESTLTALSFVSDDSDASWVPNPTAIDVTPPVATRTRRGRPPRGAAASRRQSSEVPASEVSTAVAGRKRKSTPTSSSAAEPSNTHPVAKRSRKSSIDHGAGGSSSSTQRYSRHQSEDHDDDHEDYQDEDTHQVDNPYVYPNPPLPVPKGFSLQPDGTYRTATKPFMWWCPCEGRLYYTIGGLNAHRKLHGIGRPFVCGVCKSDFQRKQDLKRHEMTHSSVRNHICER